MRNEIIAAVNQQRRAVGVRNDADAINMARQLEHVYAQTYDTQYPELPMANGDIVPLDRTVPEGAETWTYYTYSQTGIAAAINAYAAGSIPRVGMSGKKTTGNIVGESNQYGWNVQDLAGSQMANNPLDVTLARASKRAHMQLRNQLGWFGSESEGLYGLLTHPNIPHTLAPFKSGGSTAADRTWALKSFDEILADVNSLIQTPRTTTNGLEIVTDVIVADAVWAGLVGRAVAAGNASNATIANFLIATYPGVKFSTAFELQASGHASVAEFAGQNLAVAFNRSKVGLVVPKDYTQMPPQWVGLEMAIFTHSRVGGLRCPYPLSVNVLRGI